MDGAQRHSVVNTFEGTNARGEKPWAFFFVCGPGTSQQSWPTRA